MTILGKLDQEYLLRTIESGMALGERRQLFLWSQGPLQALLPHEALLCMELGAAGTVERVECLHRAVVDGAALVRLKDTLAPALAAVWRAGPGLPAIIEAHGADEHAALLCAAGFDNALVHGCLPARGAATVFALLAMPVVPEGRHAYLLQLLLPYLHLALLRMPGQGGADGAGGEVPGRALARALSGRELAILGAVRAGRSNGEVARQLGISVPTVKNHLQRIYRVLGVGNRAHALARCHALRLL